MEETRVGYSVTLIGSRRGKEGTARLPAVGVRVVFQIQIYRLLGRRL